MSDEPKEINSLDVRFASRPHMRERLLQMTTHVIPRVRAANSHKGRNYQPSENNMTQTNNQALQPNAKFWAGRFFATERARKEIGFEQILTALNRHKGGDWGDLCPEDWEANEKALQDGGRLFSVYYDQNGTKFWIITDGPDPV